MGCSKPNCDCLEKEENRIGGPVKYGYPCLGDRFKGDEIKSPKLPSTPQPGEDFIWFGNRKGIMYFIERSSHAYGGKWRCMGEGFTRSDIPADENMNWTDSPDAALAWKTKEGAEIWKQKYFIDGFVTEHEFIDGKPKLPSTPLDEANA